MGRLTGHLEDNKARRLDAELAMPKWVCSSAFLGGTMKIETERLVLREMTPDDYDALYAVLADSDIMEH